MLLHVFFTRSRKKTLPQPLQALIISENWNQRKKVSIYISRIDYWMVEVMRSMNSIEWKLHNWKEGHGSANSTLSLNESDSVPTQPYVRFTASREHNYFTTPLTILYTFISHAYLVSKLFHPNFTTSSNCKCKPIPIYT